jgi:hypothetical protein
MVENDEHQVFIFHTYFLKSLMYKRCFFNIILYFHYKLEYLLALYNLYLFRI